MILTLLSSICSMASAVYYPMTNDIQRTSLFSSSCDGAAEEKIGRCSAELATLGVFTSTTRQVTLSELRTRNKEYFVEMCQAYARYNTCLGGTYIKQTCYPNEPLKSKYAVVDAALEYVCGQGYESMLFNWDCYLSVTSSQEITMCESTFLEVASKREEIYNDYATGVGACFALQTYVDCIRPSIERTCGISSFEAVVQAIERPVQELPRSSTMSYELPYVFVDVNEMEPAIVELSKSLQMARQILAHGEVDEAEKRAVFERSMECKAIIVRYYADKKKVAEQETLSTAIDQELLSTLEKEGELRVACIQMEHEAKMANIRCRQVDSEIQENRTRLYNAMKEVARLKDQIIQLKEKKTKRDLTHVSMLQATRQRVAELSAKVDDSITIRQAHEQEVSIEELSKQLGQIDAQKEKLAGELVVAERDLRTNLEDPPQNFIVRLASLATMHNKMCKQVEQLKTKLTKLREEDIRTGGADESNNLSQYLAPTPNNDNAMIELDSDTTRQASITESAPRSDVFVLAQPTVPLKSALRVPVPPILAATSSISVPVREVTEQQEQGKSQESQETEKDGESRNASGEESNGEEEETMPDVDMDLRMNGEGNKYSNGIPNNISSLSALLNNSKDALNSFGNLDAFLQLFEADVGKKQQQQQAVTALIGSAASSQSQGKESNGNDSSILDFSAMFEGEDDRSAVGGEFNISAGDDDEPFSFNFSQLSPSQIGAVLTGNATEDPFAFFTSDIPTLSQANGQNAGSGALDAFNFAPSQGNTNGGDLAAFGRFGVNDSPNSGELGGGGFFEF
ncbi:hypothetical protein WR25_05193 [Diploscapter pachys]|uniref:Chondroitin proteoglycan 4 domain-containing protein n=1 Tax=Diploscapter pachys TaxID=2018661 RepID=A0A2A2KZF8_9BILA|nr:hypothetical protein WR25_05193 [Diploscapter pachys]